MTRHPESAVCDIFDTPVGAVVVVSRGRELVAARIVGGKASAAAARKAFPDVEIASSPTEAGRQFREYFAGKRRAFSLKVDLGAMPPFCRKVLDACAKVPFGSVTTYKDLARAAGSPRAARAAGSAVASNPCLIAIPCHRVLGTAGLGGFSAVGGLETKRKLLRHEGIMHDKAPRTADNRPTSRPKAR